MFFFFDFDKSDPDYERLLLLNNLIERFENELVEFKEANNDYDKNKIGQYVSAISNEANLKGQQFGWLVFGIQNNRKVIGSNYREKSGLDRLKQEIADGTGGVTFIEIFEVYPNVEGENKRVILFQIPAAPTALPTPWKGHYYSRNGESLSYLSIEKLDRIRGQHKKDWSKQIVEGASLACLNSTAIAIAREKYKVRMNRPHIAEETDKMTDMEFLTKLKLVIDGKVTNAAMVLLGNSDFDYLLETVPKIMWRLYGAAGEDKDYEIFTIPFISVVDKVYEKIRNLTYRYMPDQMSLFPIETDQYDQSLIRELINNCIAHQDYTIGGRIYINEFEDKIKVTNPGSFLPHDIQIVLEPSYSPPYYRNQLLAEVMTNLLMIDTATMGIRKIFNIQKDKYFPLPDYNLTKTNEVAVTVYGKVLNENYTRLLFDNRDFDLNTVFLLDKVQKCEPITKQETLILRKLGVVEGKAPNLFISSKVAKIVGEKAQYIKNKGFDDEYYKDLIIDFIKKFGKANKTEIRDLLFEKLPAVLSEVQKENKIRNLLTNLKAKKIIDRDSDNNQKSNWILVKQ